MGNCCSNNSADDQYVEEDPGLKNIPNDFQEDLPPMSPIVPTENAPLRSVYDHIIAEVPKVLADAGMRSTVELVEVKDAPTWTVFWRITVVQEEDEVDVHSKILDVQEGIEASIKYIYNVRLDCHPQCVCWFVTKPERKFFQNWSQRRCMLRQTLC